MKILVISDTHGRINNIEIIKNREKDNIDRAIHLGDAEGIEDRIKTILSCPVDMVRGNCDFFSNIEDHLALKIGNHNCLITHGHLMQAKRSHKGLINAAKEIGADFVFYGHTHIPMIITEDGVTLVNPGSLSYPRGNSPSYIIMEVNEDGEIKLELKYIG